MEQDCSVTEGEVWTEDAEIIYTGPEREADLTWDREIDVKGNLLMPGFKPVLDFNRTSNTIKQANKLMIELPAWANWICSGIIIAYALVALYRYLRRKMKKA